MIGYKGFTSRKLFCRSGSQTPFPEGEKRRPEMRLLFAGYISVSVVYSDIKHFVTENMNIVKNHIIIGR